MLPENLPLPDELHCLFQTWTSTTYFLVSNGCSAHLFKTLYDICTRGQVDEACIGAIQEHLSKISAYALFDRFDSNRRTATTSKSFVTNHQNYSDTDSLESCRLSDIHLSAGRGVSQPTNELYKGVSSSSIKDEPDTVTNDVTDDVTDDETDEEDDSDVDNAFGVSSRLVCKNASLSQYQSRSTTQAFADTLVTEELNLTDHGGSVVDFTALADIVSLQNPWSRAGLPTSRSSSPLNPVSLDPPVALVNQAFAAGSDNSTLASGHGCDAYRGERQDSTRQITDSFVSTEASPSSKPLQIQTQEQQVTSPRESVSNTGGSAIPPDIVAQIQRIASPERILPLWHYLRAQRISLTAIGADKKPAATEPLDTAEERIGTLLSNYQMQYEMASDDVDFPELHRRLYLADIYRLYHLETTTRRQNPRQRKRKRRTADNGRRTASRSLKDIFIDFLLPQLQNEGGTRQNAKRRFENWMALGRICAKLIEHFGEALLLLLPPNMSNER